MQCHIKKTRQHKQTKKQEQEQKTPKKQNQKNPQNMVPYKQHTSTEKWLGFFG